jgi:PPP family 3-phenylpropionic acid transporter
MHSLLVLARICRCPVRLLMTDATFWRAVPGALCDACDQYLDAACTPDIRSASQVLQAYNKLPRKFGAMLPERGARSEALQPHFDLRSRSALREWTGLPRVKSGGGNPPRVRVVPARFCYSLAMSRRSPLLGFLALYSGMFAAFGVVAPFFPGLLLQDGLGSGAIGVVLAAGTAIRLLAGPFGGQLADRTGRPALILSGFAAAAAVIALGYAPARGLPLLLLISVAHASVLAPVTPIADALALGSASNRPGFGYGWVRAAGSGAFIVGTLVSGRLVEGNGPGIIVWLNAGLLAVTACFAWLVPNRVTGARLPEDSTGEPRSFRRLVRIPMFRRLMIVAALIGGSHALHDGFEVIRWRAAGLSPEQASLLWSSSVAAEVFVFLFLGRWLLNRLGPGRAMILAALAGVVRWATAAQTAWFPFMAIVEPLHGLTFALLHLACMDMISRIVPIKLAATAQTFYATIAMGATSAAVTLAAGPIYGHFGAAAFWAMAAMCALSIPAARGIRLS